jgi:Rrf2 family protein
MKISKSTELAIHGLWMLGKKRSGMLLISEMARAQGASQSYLAKVFQRMARSGLVRSTRGKRGGFRLARKPADISMADVVRAMEAQEPLYDCLYLSRGCKGKAECLLRETFKEAEQVMYAALERITLGDLITRSAADKRVRWLRQSIT